MLAGSPRFVFEKPHLGSNPGGRFFRRILIQKRYFLF